MTRPGDRTSEGVFDLAGNVAEWTRSKFRIRDGTMRPWGYSYRAGRGLPLSRDPPAPDRLPPSSATFRRRFCDGAGCDAEEAAALRREIGLRCVRHSAR
jgi:formylglycine-generating enzyme required for sulfatase activity